MISPLCSAPHDKKGQQRGTITIGSPVHGAFQPKRLTSTESRVQVSPAVYPRLLYHHFDIQSRRGYHNESHGFSCACFQPL